MKLSRRDLLKCAGFAGLSAASGVSALASGRGPVGVALCIGLNSIDPSVYGDNGLLSGCVPDATDMTQILRSQGFLVRTLWDAPWARNNHAPRDVGTKQN